jgi:hypothetical protein
MNCSLFRVPSCSDPSMLNIILATSAGSLSSGPNSSPDSARLNQLNPIYTFIKYHLTTYHFR